MRRLTTVTVLTLLLGLCPEVHSDVPPDAHAVARMPTTLGDWAQGAQLFGGLGSFHRAVTPPSPPETR